MAPPHTSNGGIYIWAKFNGRQERWRLGRTKKKFSRPDTDPDGAIVWRGPILLVRAHVALTYAFLQLAPKGNSLLIQELAELPEGATRFPQ